MGKTKYVLVGTGGRCSMYLEAMCKTFADKVELKAILERQKETQRQLDAIYAEKGDEWVARIVARATGDDK